MLNRLNDLLKQEQETIKLEDQAINKGKHQCNCIKYGY